jgi:hypothetical protein
MINFLTSQIATTCHALTGATVEFKRNEEKSKVRFEPTFDIIVDSKVSGIQFMTKDLNKALSSSSGAIVPIIQHVVKEIIEFTQKN